MKRNHVYQRWNGSFWILAFVAFTSGTLLQSCALPDLRYLLVDAGVGFAEGLINSLAGNLVGDPDEDIYYD